ncbi:MAG TPA: hypothetical protein VJW77_04215 [Terriglobia bacterium]|nr:hypothetical protein [Terriglobia bacterium]
MKSLENGAITDQFFRLKIVREKPDEGVEAWTAVYENGGNHVAISSPTLGALSESYEQLTGFVFQREKAQHVVITPYRASDSEAKHKQKGVGDGSAATEAL